MGACQPTTRGRAKGMEELRGWPDGPGVIRRRRRGWNVSFVGREREKPPPGTVSYQKEIKKAVPTHHPKGGKKMEHENVDKVGGAGSARLPTFRPDFSAQMPG